MTTGTTAAAPVAASESVVDDRLSFIDQALYLGLRATGQAAVMQCVWVYERPVDLDGVRRFHRNFGYGLAGRLIEPSILPFGRHRWVAATGPAWPLDVAPRARARADLSDWIDERAQRAIDPEFGPGWHLGVLPMSDGATAVSLVGSHCLGDGGAALLSVYDAVQGNRRDLGYRPPESRTRREALRADARQTLADLPETGRTLAAAVRLGLAQYRARRARPQPDRTAASPSPVSMPAGAPADPGNVVVPAVTAFVPIADWDDAAARRGGNSHSLLAGLAALLARAQGRADTADGQVPLIVPINDRTLVDTRANAVNLAYVRVDPGAVTADLAPARSAIREALRVMRSEPDEKLALMPLTPFVPRRAVRRSADLAFGFEEQPVSCSNLGDIPDEVSCVDGTPADYVMLRGVDRRVSSEVLRQRRGLLTVVGSRIGGRVSLTVVAYRVDAANDKAELRRAVHHALAEFDLTATIV